MSEFLEALSLLLIALIGWLFTYNPKPVDFEFRRRVR